MKAKLLRIVLPAALVIGFCAIPIRSQASFIPIGRGTNYFQNFDYPALPKSSTSKTTPAGWFAGTLAGENLNTTIYADNGSSSLGAIYSYGLTGDNNRALGLFDDGKSFNLFGAAFENTGPGSINRVNISYTGEEWRLGANENPNHRNSLQFVYAITTGNYPTSWGNVPGLSFSTPNLFGVGSHDGTQAGNQVNVSSSISFLNIPQGSMLWIAWYEQLGSGNKVGDGLAIDKFSLAVVPEASTALGGLAATALCAAALRRSRSASARAEPPLAAT